MCMSKSVNKNNNYNSKSFIDGVKEGAAGNLLNSAFHVRTNQLFKKNTAEENYHFLSGLVIGFELKDVMAVPGNIYLICSDNLSHQYLTALDTLNNNNIQYYDAGKALIKAHCKLAHHLHLK